MITAHDAVGAEGRELMLSGRGRGAVGTASPVGPGFSTRPHVAIMRGFIVDVDRAVLDRVRRTFPIEPIRTLDAVHLATAERLGEHPSLVTIVTRATRVRSNAEALGYAVE
jgi:hypothetical protein